MNSKKHSRKVLVCDIENYVTSAEAEKFIAKHIFNGYAYAIIQMFARICVAFNVCAYVMITRKIICFVAD